MYIQIFFSINSDLFDILSLYKYNIKDKFSFLMSSNNQATRLYQRLSEILKAPIQRHEEIRSKQEIRPPIKKQQDQKIDEKINNMICLRVMIQTTEQSKLKLKSVYYSKIAQIYKNIPSLGNKFVMKPSEVMVKSEQFLKKKIPIWVCIEDIIFDNDEQFEQIQQFLENDLVTQFVINRRNSNNQKREQCINYINSKCPNIQLKYKAYVRDASELKDQFQRSKLESQAEKANFMRLNKSLDADDDNFDAILIETKPYLSESIKMQSQQQLKNSLKDFKDCVDKQKTKQNNSSKQQKIDKFFKFAQNYIDKKQFGQTDQEKLKFYQTIVKVYSDQTKIYHIVNMKLKSITSQNVFKQIAFFCKFLYQAISYSSLKKISIESLKQMKINGLLELYRGTFMGQKQWNQMIKSSQKRKIQNHISYLMNVSFFSTSKSKHQAIKFIRGDFNNKILIIITFHPDFFQFVSDDDYLQFEKYISFFIDMQATKTAQSKTEEQVLFNCFNVFSILEAKEQKIQITVNGQQVQKSMKVLRLQYCSHIDILKKINENSLMNEEREVLNSLLKVDKSRDMVQVFLQKGKGKQFVEYINDKIQNKTDLTISEYSSYTTIACETGNTQILEQMIKNTTTNQIPQIKSDSSLSSIVQVINSAIIMSVYGKQFQSSELIDNVFQKSQKLAKSKSKILREEMLKTAIKQFHATSKKAEGNYQECIVKVKENISNISTYVKCLQLNQYTETIIQYFQFMKKQVKNCNQLDMDNKQFVESYKIGWLESIKKLIEEQNNQNQFKKMVEEHYTSDFIQKLVRSINEHIQLKIFLKNIELKKKLQNYKDSFFLRQKKQMEVIKFYYEVLLRSQKKSIGQRQQHNLRNNQQLQYSINNQNEFHNFFKSYKQYFKHMKRMYDLQQKNEQRHYERAMFLQNYCQFQHGYAIIYETESTKIAQLNQQIQSLLLKAKQILKQIHINKQIQKHPDINRIQQIRLSFISDRFPENIQKYQMIKSKLFGSTSSYDQNKEQVIKNRILFIQGLTNLVQSFRHQNSFLSQMKCLSSIISVRISQIMNSSINLEETSQYQKYIVSGINQLDSLKKNSQFYKNHQSNALNQFLKSQYQFYRGNYQASIDHLRQSQNIIDFQNNKKESQIKKEDDGQTRNQKLKKIKNIRENKQIKISICILRAKICVNYWSQDIQKCLQDIRNQQKFIKDNMDPDNTNLIDLCYWFCKILLQKGQGKLQLSNIHKQCLQEINKCQPLKLAFNGRLSSLKILQLLGQINPSQLGKKQKKDLINGISDKYKLDSFDNRHFDGAMHQYRFAYYFIKYAVANNNNKEDYLVYLKKMKSMVILKQDTVGFTSPFQISMCHLYVQQIKNSQKTEDLQWALLTIKKINQWYQNKQYNLKQQIKTKKKTKSQMNAKITQIMFLKQFKTFLKTAFDIVKCWQNQKNYIFNENYAYFPSSTLKTNLNNLCIFLNQK